MLELQSGTRYLATDESRFVGRESLPHKKPAQPKLFELAPFERGKKNVINVLAPICRRANRSFMTQ